MDISNIPLKDIQALLGEKDMIIYALSKNYEELEAMRAFQVTALTNKLEECGIATTLNFDRRKGISFTKIEKSNG